MCGAKIGLCLPRRTRATSVHRRPRTRPSASTTCQARVISLAFGEYVRITRLPSSAVAPAGSLRGTQTRIGAVATPATSRTAHGGRRRHASRLADVEVSVADLPQDQPVGRGDRPGRSAVLRPRGWPASRPRDRCRSPTSTSVPTIERTIWWQNAVARISNRSSIRSSGSLQRVSSTRRTQRRRRLARGPAWAGGRTRRSRAHRPARRRRAASHRGPTAGRRARRCRRGTGWGRRR